MVHILSLVLHNVHVLVPVIGCNSMKRSNVKEWWWVRSKLPFIYLHISKTTVKENLGHKTSEEADWNYYERLI